MSSGNERIPVVDKDDQIIGYKSRDQITRDDIYRVSACRVRDPEGNILLAQRAWTKTHSPGLRGPAVAGTVTGTETYLENILHEIQEEIGVSAHVDEITIGPKRFRTEDWVYFGQRFFFVWRGDKNLLHAEPGAVAALKRLSKDELHARYLAKPEEFTHSMGRCLSDLENIC